MVDIEQGPLSQATMLYPSAFDDRVKYTNAQATARSGCLHLERVGWIQTELFRTARFCRLFSGQLS